MTLKEITFDILRLLQKSKLVDDSRLSDRQIQYKINQYRASGIRETFMQTGEIEPIWIQSLGTEAVTDITYTEEEPTIVATEDDKVTLPGAVTATTTTTTEATSYVTFNKVNSADDANLQGCDCIVGKYVMPEIVSLPGKRGSFHDRGIFRVSQASRQIPYFPTSINRFYSLVNGSYRAKHNYYWKIQNNLYTHPYKQKMSLLLILDNPLDAGITEDDPYPISNTMLEYIVMKILTQDFNIEAKVAADLRNDAADALIALQQQATKR